MTINPIILKLQSLVQSLSIKSVYSAIIVAITSAIGQNMLAYEVLFILVILDTVTGVMKGVKNRNLSSKGFKGTAYKLILYFTLIIAAHQLTRLQDILVWVEDFIVVYLAVTEVLSIIENTHQLGVSLPKWVSERLCQYLGHEEDKYGKPKTKEPVQGENIIPTQKS